MRALCGPRAIRAGLVQQRVGDQWGSTVDEQRFELRL
jgi:hypothetical protein